MGCGSEIKKIGKSIEGEVKRQAGQVESVHKKAGQHAEDWGNANPFGVRDDIKQGWDDMRGATARKAAEDAAKQVENARALSETYQRGAKATPKKTQKTGAGRGARGTRLVRQPLGTYKAA